MIWVPVLAMALLLSVDARAHGFAPAVVRVDEHTPNVFTIASSEPSAVAFRSPTCASEPEIVRCGEAGLSGGVFTASARDGDVFVRISFRTGDTVFRALSPGESFEVPPRDGDETPRAELFARFFRLGVVHLALGFDHLLFLGALVLAVPRLRSLLLAVTAFSIAHALSLCLLASGVVSVPSAPVEACIALSIVVMAREALGPSTGFLRTHPSLAVVPLGLLHGLGFGAALAETGIARARLVESVFAFHVGVEVAQLVFATTLFAALAAAANARARVTWPASILVGAAGCAITLERALLLGT